MNTVNRHSGSMRGQEEIPNHEGLDVAVQSKIIHPGKSPLWKGLKNETPHPGANWGGHRGPWDYESQGGH